MVAVLFSWLMATFAILPLRQHCSFGAALRCWERRSNVGMGDVSFVSGAGFSLKPVTGVYLQVLEVRLIGIPSSATAVLMRDLLGANLLKL